jgi:NitT/TauT family transport system permease protein
MGGTVPPASCFDVARTLGAGRRYLIFHVAVPAALPTIFTAGA